MLCTNSAQLGSSCVCQIQIGFGIILKYMIVIKIGIRFEGLPYKSSVIADLHLRSIVAYLQAIPVHSHGELHDNIPVT